MKIKVLIVGCIFTTTAMSMETTNSFNITSFGTKITVTQESLFEASNKTDLLVLGANDQNTLKTTILFDYNVGAITLYPKNSPIYLQGHDNDRSDTTYKTADYYSNVTIKTKSRSKDIPYEHICIVEPLITQSPPHSYNSKYQVIKESLTPFEFHKKEAIIQACNDLKICYTKALTKGLELLKDELSKRIAVAPISTNFGIPRNKATPIAINTTLTFIREHLNQYNEIRFFVEKNADFDLYKKLLQEHDMALTKKNCLMYHILATIGLLPLELQNLILFLTMSL